MVTTSLIDLLRSREPTLRLFVDEEGEPYEGYPLNELGEGMDDPSYEAAQETNFRELLAQVLSELSTFPSRQQSALLCVLRDHVDDPESLEIQLQRMGFQQTAFTWPEDSTQRRLLLAILPLARKRLWDALRLPPSSSEQHKVRAGRNTLQPESPENLQYKSTSAYTRSIHGNPTDQHTQNKVPPNEEFTNRPFVDIDQLETLPEPSRTAIRLRYIERLSYDQMADCLRISKGTLRSQVSRGMNQLQSPRSQPRTLSLQYNVADVEAVLKHLREPYRVVIGLHYLEHLTYPQMAQQLHCPLGTIKSLVSRANKLMRQHLSSSTPAAIEPVS